MQANPDELKTAEEVQAIRLEMVSAEQIQAVALAVSGTQPLGAALAHIRTLAGADEVCSRRPVHRGRNVAAGRGTGSAAALVAAHIRVVMVC